MEQLREAFTLAMRRRFRTLTSGLLLVAGLGLSQSATAACLLGDYSVQAEYDRSVSVVTAEVVAQRPMAESDGYYEGVVYTVKVNRVYKGGNAQRLVDLFSEDSSGRFPMQRRGRYVLFIYSEKGRLMVDNCGNSGPASEKTKALQALDRIEAPPGNR